MTDTSSIGFDIEEQRVRIQRAISDIEEQRVRIQRAISESEKFVAEQRKLGAEADKLARDRALAPWQIALSGMAAGAAFFGAGAAFIKLLGP